MRTNRPLAGLATLALAVSLTACGGGGASGAPTDASQDEFCEAFDSLFEGVGEESSTEPPTAEESLEVLQNWADELEQAGTPEDAPEEVRRGFEVAIDAVNDLDAGDIESPDDLDQLDQFGSEGDQEDAEAFSEWAFETCDSLAGLIPDAPELPSDLPTDLPTELPSDFPTELPSDFPSDLLSDLPSEFPSELLSDLPSDFPTDFPTELPE